MIDDEKLLFSNQHNCIIIMFEYTLHYNYVCMQMQVI